MTRAISSFVTKPFSDDKLQDLLSFVTYNARHRWPGVTYVMNSDIIWQLPAANPERMIRLWYDKDPDQSSDAELLGFAWLQLNGPVLMDLRAGLGWKHPVAANMLDWLETARSQYPPAYPWLLELTNMDEWEQALTDELPLKLDSNITFQVSCFDQDVDRAEFLASRGYSPSNHFHYSMLRSLNVPIPSADLPPGFSIRHVEADDFAERVATHRDAWFKSGYNLAAYTELRDSPSFNHQLDLVAVAPDGRFGSYCVGWLDEVFKVGSFEPVGTRPAFRRLGLGQQVNYEGLRRMKQMGMLNASIGTAGFNDRAFGLYSSCGFELIDRNRTYTKTPD